jgi:general secretion pathway protein C
MLSSPRVWLDRLAPIRRQTPPRAPHFAIGALALALATEGGLIAVRIVAASHPVSAHGQPTAATFPRLDRTSSASIIRAHLFGQPPAPPVLEQVVQSDVALFLSGIIATEDPKSGMAIIGSTAAEGTLYAVGDRIAGDAMLHSVYEDHVLIERKGRLESLLLPKQYRQGASEPFVASTARGTESLSSFRQFISPQPVKEGGSLQGFRVFPGSSRARTAFLSAGLRPGDVITEIDGTRLADETSSNEVFRTLASASQVRVEVLRDGLRQYLTLDMTKWSEADSED